MRTYPQKNCARCFTSFYGSQSTKYCSWECSRVQTQVVCRECPEVFSRIRVREGGALCFQCKKAQKERRQQAEVQRAYTEGQLEVVGRLQELLVCSDLQKEVFEGVQRIVHSYSPVTNNL